MKKDEAIDRLRDGGGRFGKQPYKTVALVCGVVWSIVVAMIAIPIACLCVLLLLAPFFLCERLGKFRWLPLTSAVHLVAVVLIANVLFGATIAICVGVLILGNLLSTLSIFPRPRVLRAVCNAVDNLQGPMGKKLFYRRIRVHNVTSEYCDLELELREFTIPPLSECCRVYDASGMVGEIPIDEYPYPCPNPFI